MSLFVPKFLANKTISLVFNSEDTDENGEEKIIGEISTKCRMQKDDGTAYLADGKKADLRAKVFVFDELDKFPDEIFGECTIDGTKYQIAKASKMANPDGTINHVVLELM